MTDRAKLGRSSQRRGQAAQREAAADLRASGLYPDADHVGTWPRREGVGDLTGVGDVTAEVTIRPWAEIEAKMAQAEWTAGVGGHGGPWFVMKRRRDQPAGLGRWWVVFRGDVAWELLARTARLEEDEAALLQEIFWLQKS